MDFKILFSIIKKNFKFIAVFTGIVILAALIYSWRASGGYNVSVSVSVYSKVNQPTQEYQYDGYYSIKAADEFSNTVSQWFKSREVVNAINKKAGADSSGGYLRLLFSALKVQKLAPQFLEADFKVANPADGAKIAKAMDFVLQERAGQASKFSGNAVFTVIAGEPITTRNQADYIFNSIIAFIGGFLLGIFIVLLKQE